MSGSTGGSLLSPLAFLRGVGALLPCVGLTHLFLPSDPGPVNLTVISCTVCQLSPKMAGRTTRPQRCLSHPCVSAFICSLGLFLTAGWPPPADSFLSGFWSRFFLFTYPDLPSSLCHCFHASLGTERGLSLHLAGLSFSPLSAPVPLPAYLASRTRTPCWCCSLPCRCTCLGVATDTSSFSVLLFPRPSYCWVVTDFPVILETFFPSEISQVCKASPCACLPPSTPGSEGFHLYSLWWVTHMPWNVHP